MQQKTQRPVQFEVTEPTREVIGAWIAHARLKSESSLFPSRLHGSMHLSTRQYARIVDSWVRQLGSDKASYGTHTMRRTNGPPLTRNLRRTVDYREEQRIEFPRSVREKAKLSTEVKSEEPTIMEVFARRRRVVLIDPSSSELFRSCTEVAER